MSIATWNVGKTPVVLKPDAKGLRTEGIGSFTFSPRPYHLYYAINLVKIFHHTIQANLEKEPLHSSCFLPKLCVEVENAKGTYAGLFGHLNVMTGEVKGLRWGLWGPDNKRETFEVGAGDSMARTFIKDSTSLAKRFSVTLCRDDSGRIQGVFLNCTSLLDRKVVLDELNWAVTFVSALDSTKNSCSKVVRGQVGHAMLACEGFKEGVAFLKYVHLTQKPQDKDPNLRDNEAQIESFVRDEPLKTVNGPTWVRSRQQVENIFLVATKNEKKRLKFSLCGNTISQVFFGDAIFNDPISFSMSCFDCLQHMTEAGGIFFRGNLPAPIHVIKQLNSGSVKCIPKDFIVHKFYGLPMPEKYDKLAKELLSLSSAFAVYLLPSDCPVFTLRWCPSIFSGGFITGQQEKLKAWSAEIRMAREVPCRSLNEMRNRGGRIIPLLEQGHHLIGNLKNYKLRKFRLLFQVAKAYSLFDPQKAASMIGEAIATTNTDRKDLWLEKFDESADDMTQLYTVLAELHKQDDNNSVRGGSVSRNFHFLELREQNLNCGIIPSKTEFEDKLDQLVAKVVRALVQDPETKLTVAENLYGKSSSSFYKHEALLEMINTIPILTTKRVLEVAREIRLLLIGKSLGEYYNHSVLTKLAQAIRVVIQNNFKADYSDMIIEDGENHNNVAPLDNKFDTLAALEPEKPLDLETKLAPTLTHFAKRLAESGSEEADQAIDDAIEAVVNLPEGDDEAALFKAESLTEVASLYLAYRV